MPTPFVASHHANDRKYHLLLAASGSVATIKLPNIIQGLESESNLSIRIILTASAKQFLQGQSDEQPSLSSLLGLPNVDGIYLDEDEWEVPWARHNAILHIELRRWADLLIIAPLSANTLAKISNGICDNLLTSVVRAWQVETTLTDPLLQRRIVVAPAMNTSMWRHPITQTQLSRFSHSDAIGEWHWLTYLRPVEKTLACGDTGDGAMCPWNDIVHVVRTNISWPGIIRDKAS